jgi:putative transposase
VVRVRGKGSDRVSVAGLVCVKPGQPGRFFYRLQVHRHGQHRPAGRRALSEADYAALFTAAHRKLHAPMIVIWDNLNTHRTKAMQAFTRPRCRWLTLVWLPAYAPELNAAEGAWATMKHPLANRALPSIDYLAALMHRRLRRIQHHPQLINGFLAQTGLTLNTRPP